MIKRRNLPISFGSLIRKTRLDLGIGQRELAKKIGIGHHLNDIEKEKRPAPKNTFIKKLAKTLNLSLNKLNDLAGISKKSTPPDVNDFINKNPKIITILRLLEKNNVSEEQLSAIDKIVNKEYTKVLIIAAGLGSRLKKHTENLPKCMLDFGGKTLLQRQLDAYKKNDINDISIVRGYKKKKLITKE